MITVDVTDRMPIYEQICKEISKLISKGLLKENDKLPSAREMAKNLGLNPNTVAKAYSRLEQEKIIYSVAGKGCFVAEQKGMIENKIIDEFTAAVDEALSAGIEHEILIGIINQRKEMREHND